MYGIRAAQVKRGQDPQQLVDPALNKNRGMFGSSHVTVLDPGHDPIKDGNAVRRRVKVFGENDAFMRSINKQLGGGESHPVLVAGLGIAVGLVSGGAGIAFTVATTAIDIAKYTHPARARTGDAIDRYEVLGTRGGKVVHMDQLILVDLLRAKAGIKPSQWVIHCQYSDVTFQ
ncbi:MAG: hypothetical protein AAF439_06875 [Pseudomonadota bacterium]